MERRSIAIHGTVQGVGFRPFVHGLASRLHLGGFVRNDTGGVEIEVEGEPAPLDQFLSNLVSDAPALAHIQEVTWRPLVPQGDRGFRIERSGTGAAGPVTITADAATCPDCLRELMDPADRRYRYPFLNCTNCGPRLTIVTGAPYDRERTTMAAFAMCPACRAEYDDPADRRFHAQPTACPACGPQVRLLDAHGRDVACPDPIDELAAALRAGKVAAVKGLGGYHLVCDATSAAAVNALRQRKKRDEKPFAVMVRDLEAAARICDLSDAERRLLQSHHCPIVLLRKKDPPTTSTETVTRAADQPPPEIAAQVAPGNPYLGVMLPYTPLHHLLMQAADRPALVMTSANRSDEPIAIDETDALSRLAGIADLFLVHNRPIQLRCDDSVTRIIGGQESPIRRSRGYAPEPLAVPWNATAPILAVGGQMKGTFALASENRAILSHHLGDLDHFAAYRAFERDIRLYEQLFSLRPTCIAHDLHPDYASTRYARRRTAEEGLPLIPVQHHHAHMTSCMAEHGLTQPVIGVTFDGTGYGTDGAIWGGEFLVGDYHGFQRASHLDYVGMPGGERAAREPWRMAASHLAHAGATRNAFERRIPRESLRIARHMLERRLNSPQTSSIGRLFDAIASLIGLRDHASFEGQAAMQLEWLATSAPDDSVYPWQLTETDSEAVIDVAPLIRAVAHDVDAGIDAPRIARRFHTTLAEIIATVCLHLRNRYPLSDVVLSGGVFINALLAVESTTRLEAEGFRVYRHHKVPANDGGLSLGQLAVAAARQGSL